jgi:NhaP-type Na+/H+ or K+/H+ antiporter
MWMAGLRGAMAYALAMESSKNPIFTDPARERWAGNVMLLVTLLYSLFTILGVSSVLNPMMTWCEVTRASAGAATGEESTERDETEAALIDSMEDHDRERRCCTRLKAKLSHFDKYVFSPLFIKDEDKMAKRSGRLEDPNLKYKDDIDWARESTHRSKSQIDAIKEGIKAQKNSL